MKRTASLTLALATIAGIVATPALESAHADGIYMKNGRVIRVQEARVEGERVVFVLHGAQQAIPLYLVDRVDRDDWSPLPAASAASQAATLSAVEEGLGAASAPSVLAATDPAERMRALSEMLGSGAAGGIDTSQALSLLQTLGSMQGSADADALAGLMPALGALGASGAGVSGDLGSLASDLATIQAILPALSRLGAALFAPEYSEDATNAAARELLASLSRAGVSQAEIEAYARRLGVPDSILQQLR